MPSGRVDLTLYTPETGDDIGDDIGTAMSYVHGTTRIGVGDRDIQFLFVGGIYFKYVLPFLIGIPF